MSEPLDVIRRARLRVAERITDLIGDTPIVRLHKFERDTPGVELWAKCEFLNPGGSVKDRAAYQMIRDAIRTGALKPGQTIIDSTSGNTGVAYSLIGGALGFPVTLVMPGNVSWARRKITEAFGTTLVFSDPMEGSDGAIRLCRKMVEENPGALLLSRPVLEPVEPARPLQHHRARDLGADRGARHPLRDRHRHHRHGDGDRAAAEGVSPRHRGLGRRAGGRAARPRGAQAHGELDGPRHLPPRGARTASCRWTTDEAWDVSERLAKEEGLLVGHSSGASLAGGLRIAKQLVAAGKTGRDRHAVPRSRRTLLRGAGRPQGDTKPDDHAMSAL